eukprot:CAMPEP_0185306222 /NCGR_PEP_ID=MMETSP1363-20130426/15944_1 /TAXON_ID=38817 /ORGANISM="Gephyrocapsa oceanica, Strain RCC1303" /LENGTH=48 /DNA_ID= /DNA_START= /DNA_END= /DNA_ORIENTATION=
MSSTLNGFPASHLIDGSTSTSASALAHSYTPSGSSSGTADAWLEIDLG